MIQLQNISLIAQSRVMDLGRGFRDDNAIVSKSDILVGIACIVGAGLFFLLLRYLRNRQDLTRVCNSPRKLFNSLCKLHGLSRQERHLLRQTAAANSLKHPGQLFVAPALLTQMEMQATPHKNAQLRALREKLFGDSLAVA